MDEVYERKTIVNERATPIHDALVTLPSLRDQFAMAALPLVFPNTSATTTEIAEAAFAVADAMMEARK